MKIHWSGVRRTDLDKWFREVAFPKPVVVLVSKTNKKSLVVPKEVRSPVFSGVFSVATCIFCAAFGTYSVFLFLPTAI